MKQKIFIDKLRIIFGRTSFRLLLLTGLFLSASLFSETIPKNSTEDLFQQANRYYKSQQYTDAIKLYESLLKQHPEIPFLHYNVANTYLRLYETQSFPSTPYLAKAIYHYQKAIILNPLYRAAKNNLKIAMNMCQITYEGPTDFVGSLAYLYQVLRYKGLILSVIFVFLCGNVLYFYLRQNKLSKSQKRRQRLFVVIISMTYLITATGEKITTLFLHQKVSQKAIVLSKQVSMKLDPDASAEAIFEMYEGNIVNVEKEHETWTMISLPNGRSGWLPKKALLSFKVSSRRPGHLVTPDLP